MASPTKLDNKSVARALRAFADVLDNESAHAIGSVSLQTRPPEFVTVELGLDCFTRIAKSQAGEATLSCDLTVWY